MKSSFYWFGIIANVGCVVFFKYISLIVGQYHPMLPIGLSFLVFRNLAYIFDVANESTVAIFSLREFLAFSFFFPQLLSGPITRKDQIVPQFQNWKQNPHIFEIENVAFPFFMGLAKKVIIADRIGLIISPLLKDISGLNFTSAWVLSSAYAIQIYFDFSGYTDMAIAVGRLFDIELPPNFDKPYSALNPSDFWNRWHMTLASFLRDYIFTPFSVWGARRNASWPYLYLVVTMLIGGVWHGDGLTYVYWGFLHGIALVIYHLSRERWNRLPDFIQRFMMLIFLNFTWTFFRAPSVHDAILWSKKMLGFSNSYQTSALPLFLFPYLLIGGFIIWKFPEPSAYKYWTRLPMPVQAILGAIAAFAILNIQFSSKFLYVQF